jgi:ABC-type antimicrobial peptide transport system permease subunit
MQYYVPFAQVPGPPPGAGSGPGIGGLLVRATAGPGRLIAPIRRLVVGGRATLPYLRVRPYAELLERQVRPWRLGATLLAIFGGLAVIVAAVGLYAAFSHAVAQRRREMAIRIAVGASPSRLRTTILKEAAVVSGIGTGVGVAAALLGGRSLRTLLFGIAPADPLVLGLAAIVMLAVALLATFLPALSASRANPNALLRAE